MIRIPFQPFFLCLALSATCALQVPTPVRAEDERKRDDPFEINNPHDLTFPGRRRDYEYSRMKEKYKGNPTHFFCYTGLVFNGRPKGDDESDFPKFFRTETMPVQEGRIRLELGENPVFVEEAEK